MKKIATSFLALIFAISSFGINSLTPFNPKAEDIMLPLFGTDQKISLAQYVKLTPKEYKNLTGKKLRLKEKISLKIMQHHLKKSINKDGTVNKEKFKKFYDDDTSFHLGWFALGFFLGAIGLLIAAFTNDDKKRGRIKWVLIGWGSFVVLYLIFVVILLSNNSY